jgi:CDP-glucose 4,6-dehydratase
LEMSAVFWRDKSVFVTGHTGFKGGWLCLWLSALGAKVHGYALPPPTTPSLFDAAHVAQVLASNVIADVRHSQPLLDAMQAAKPDIVFHLAAQPLVRYSYANPAETYEVNVMGTVNLLQAVREMSSVRAIVNVTTDKCYENKEWSWGYRENDSLGGHDPYSNSKACAELVTLAFRNSYLLKSGIGLASARAGNVIGGGDWSVDRLLPDFLRALDAGQPLHIRSPNAVRPWQHVLEPLSGYLLLAERTFHSPASYDEAWNFGPRNEDVQPVRWIVERLAATMSQMQWTCDGSPQLHEAGFLKLDSSKAQDRLGWAPRWNLARALDETLRWHTAWRAGHDMRALTTEQIDTYASCGSH